MMAQANERIGRHDVETLFIVERPYGAKGGWPHSTVVLSTVRIDNGEVSVERNEIFENDSQHAEINFLAFLEAEIKNYEGASVKVRLVQNYSPCGDCADEILKFIHKNKKIHFEIKFANFYYHQIKENRVGLKKLLQNEMIDLKLLQGADTWKAFLEDETFVALNQGEEDELLNIATAEDRQTREENDVEILDDIRKEVRGKKSEDKDLADEISGLNITVEILVEEDS